MLVYPSARPSRAGDLALPADQRAVPRAAHAVLVREARRLQVRDAANPLGGEIDRDAEPRLLDEPLLHFVDRLRVVRRAARRASRP